MGFDTLLGNSRLKENLISSLNRGHISHFYLISGPAGSGKHTLARLLSAAILCSGEDKPCGRCVPCRKVMENLHPDVITVEDEELVVAFLDMVENHKMVVENSGLLTVAALKHLNVRDKRIVSILSGGNMDVITMSSVVQQGLIMRDRIFTVSVLLPDKPGELSRVAKVIAEESGNVIKLEHNQFVSINRNAAVELRITLEAFGTEHKARIMEALEREGYKPKLVRTNI